MVVNDNFFDKLWVQIVVDYFSCSDIDPLGRPSIHALIFFEDVAKGV